MSASLTDNRAADTSASPKPMKVLLLSSSYAPVLGGLQTVTQALVHNLSARGHQVQVVTNRYPRHLPEREIVDGASVQRWQFLRPSWRQLRQGRLDLFVASLYYGPSVQGRLRRLLASFRPDVVNVHFPDAQIPFVHGLKRRFGFRLVVSLHGHEVERFADNVPPAQRGGKGEASRGLRDLLNEADAVTACSRHLLQTACRLQPSVHAKGTVVYNGIDAERFHNVLPYHHPCPYVFALGRLTWKKGFDLLLQALARIDASPHDLDLIMAGEGEELAALKQLAQSLGLERRVHFLGRVLQEEVARLLSGCLFLAVPSRIEPFGIVALEGLAAGKPVVATRVGGMAEFLEQASCLGQRPRSGELGLADAGIVLVGSTVEEIAEALQNQLSRPSRMQEAAELSAYVRDQYSWRRVAQRYEQILAG